MYKTYCIIKWVKYHSDDENYWDAVGLITSDDSEERAQSTLKLLMEGCENEFITYTIQEIIKPS